MPGVPILQSTTVFPKPSALPRLLSMRTGLDMLAQKHAGRASQDGKIRRLSELSDRSTHHRGVCKCHANGRVLAGINIAVASLQHASALHISRFASLCEKAKWPLPNQCFYADRLCLTHRGNSSDTKPFKSMPTLPIMASLREVLPYIAEGKALLLCAT